MIILDNDEEQAPKLQPPPDSLHTARAPEATHLRPRDRDPILPDYETSQAQHRLVFDDLSLRALRTKGSRGWNSRLCRATMYAFTIYVVLFLVIGVPFMMTKLRAYAPWHSFPPPHEPPGGPPPPLLVGETIDLALPLFAGEAVQCNTWELSSSSDESSSSPSTSNSASLLFHLPTDTPLLIRINGTSDPAEIHGISGRLHVDLNPDVTVMDATVEVTARYDDKGKEAFRETFVCLMKSENNTGLSLYVPRNISETDNIEFNMTLLLPRPHSSSSSPSSSSSSSSSSHSSSLWSSLSISDSGNGGDDWKGERERYRMQKISTYLPYFDQSFGSVSPQVTFERMSIEGLKSRVSFDSIEASSLSVKTSEAEVSGTFNISETISLDTINGAISANVSLVHDKRQPKPTFLAFDTGNGAIEGTLTFLLHGPSHEPWLRHRHHQRYHDFVTHARTFNAPISLSVTHDPRSQHPSRYHFRALNTQAAVNVTLDEMFEGTFDVVAKSDRTSVETRAGVAKASSAAASDGDEASASEGGGMSGLWAKWLSEDRSTTASTGSSTGLGERRLEYDHEGLSSVRPRRVDGHLSSPPVDYV